MEAGFPCTSDLKESNQDRYHSTSLYSHLRCQLCLILLIRNEPAKVQPTLKGRRKQPYVIIQQKPNTNKQIKKEIKRTRKEGERKKEKEAEGRDETIWW